MTRKQANLKILFMLIKEVYKHPDIRFCQMLCNMHLPYKDSEGTDLFYEESEKTLRRIKTLKSI